MNYTPKLSCPCIDEKPAAFADHAATLAREMSNACAILALQHKITTGWAACPNGAVVIAAKLAGRIMAINQSIGRELTPDTTAAPNDDMWSEFLEIAKASFDETTHEGRNFVRALRRDRG